MVDFTHAALVIATQCACVRVRRASRAVTRLYDESLRPLGLQASQLSLLVAIAMHGDDGVPIGTLAAGLVMERTTLTRNLVPLERAGMVRVARAPDDARVRIVVLTRQGERTIASAFPLWEQAQTYVHEQLGAGKVDALGAELSRLVDLTARPTKLAGAPKPARAAKPTRTTKAAESTRSAKATKPAKTSTRARPTKHAST
ncbi:Transcriptional regulator, MarR family protein [Minicystis rosea]|nr:Transcriptional regulator, MarR family protein [Minicystis rosea]